MFDKADTAKRGYLSKNQLMEVIKDDIMNGHDEYSRMNSVKSQIFNLNCAESEIFPKTKNQKNENISRSPSFTNSVKLNNASIDNCPEKDPILRTLGRLRLETKSSHEICHNLSQALDYIQQFKIGEYKNSESKLRFLLETLIQTTNVISDNIEADFQLKEDQKQLSQKNEEMEAQIEQLLCDLESL